MYNSSTIFGPSRNSSSGIIKPGFALKNKAERTRVSPMGGEPSDGGDAAPDVLESAEEEIFNKFFF